MGLAATEQAGHHLAEAVGGNPGNRQADFGTGFTGGQGLGQVADDQQAVVAGLDLGQALGILGQLVTPGGQQFGGDNLAP
ncbi:hypothetical protein D3C84_1194420 [compost metagenome]